MDVSDWTQMRDIEQFAPTRQPDGLSEGESISEFVNWLGSSVERIKGIIDSGLSAFVFGTLFALAETTNDEGAKKMLEA